MTKRETGSHQNENFDDHFGPEKSKAAIIEPSVFLCIVYKHSKGLGDGVYFHNRFNQLKV